MGQVRPRSARPSPSPRLLMLNLHSLKPRQNNARLAEKHPELVDIANRMEAAHNVRCRPNAAAFRR